MRILLIIAAVLLTMPVRAKESSALPSEKAPQMITVDLKLVEISRTKMRQLGVNFATFDGKEAITTDGLEVFNEIPSPAFFGFIEALVKNNVARVLANPRVATLSGRPANLVVNSTVDSSQVSGTAPGDETINVGTEVRVLPVKMEDDKIMLDLLMQWSGLREESSGSSRQQLERYVVDTSLVSESGQPVSLIGQAREFKNRDGETEEVLLLLVVTPKLVETTANANHSIAK